MAEKQELAKRNRNKANMKSKLDGQKLDISNEWSWDAEKESNMSEWFAMPKEEMGKKDQSFGDSDFGLDKELETIE